MSYDVKNDLTRVFSGQVLKVTLTRVEIAKMFGIISDETTDARHKEQTFINYIMVSLTTLEIDEVFVAFVEVKITFSQ